MGTEEGGATRLDGKGGGGPGDGQAWTEMPAADRPAGAPPGGPSAYRFGPAPPAGPAYYPPPPPASQPPPDQPYPQQANAGPPYPGMPYPSAYPYPPPYLPPPQAYYAPVQGPYYWPFDTGGFHLQPYAPAAVNPLPARIGGALCMGLGVMSLVVVAVYWNAGAFLDLPFLCLALEVMASFIAIFGGLNAYQTRHFGLAVVGAIATMALAPSTLGVGFILGLVALILVALAKESFPPRPGNPFLGQGGRWA